MRIPTEKRLKFPVVICEPAREPGQSLAWRLFQGCQTRLEQEEADRRTAEIMVRDFFPEAEWPYRTRSDSYFGYYECEGGLDLWRMLMEERKQKLEDLRRECPALSLDLRSILPDTEPPFRSLFLLSLWDIFYDLPREYLPDPEDWETDYNLEKRKLQRDCQRLRKTEKQNLLALMAGSEEIGLRMVLHLDRAHENSRLFREVMARAGTILLGEKASPGKYRILANGESGEVWDEAKDSAPLVGQILYGDAP